MQRLRDAIELLDLEDWLHQHADCKEAGDNELRVSDCPKCGADKFKLYVNTDKKLWICYVCDWGRGLGDIVQLMSAISGKRPTELRIELLKSVKPAHKGELAAKLNDIFSNEDGAVQTSPLENLTVVDLPGDASFAGITTRRVYNYALHRGLDEALVSHLRLRAAGALYLHKRTGKPVKISGPFLVFPVWCADTPVSWQGRRTTNESPKYVSASNVKDWLWPLTDLFFSRYASDRIILVEGVFDAIGLLMLGHAALCTFGKSISDNQAALLQELRPSEVVFGWDMDAYREVAAAVDRVAFSFPRTFVTEFKYAGTEKKDPGDALVDQEVGRWVLQCLDQAMDVRSPEFFQWRLSRL
jgi:hypothetical protein